MRLTLPALVLGLLVAQGAMAAGDGTAALGGGLGGALGNVVGQKMGGSTGAAIGAGVAGAAGSAMAARKGSRTKAAIGGGVGSEGISVAPGFCTSTFCRNWYTCCRIKEEINNKCPELGDLLSTQSSFPRRRESYAGNKSS